MLIDKPTLRDIDKIKSYIHRHNDDMRCDLATHRRLTRIQIEEANYHSAQLELPVIALYEPTTTAIQKVQLRKIRNRIIENIQNAYQWAMIHYALNPPFIGCIAARVDPKLFQNVSEAPTRKDAVRLLGSYHIPTRPEKIPAALNTLFSQIETTPMHPVERAAYIHFHLLRIHPFSDSNGRTARIAQNAVLMYAHYAPVVIERGERDFYNALLDQAVGGYRERESQEIPSLEKLTQSELKFYNYIASKELISLEHIARILDKKQMSRTKHKTH